MQKLKRETLRLRYIFLIAQQIWHERSRGLLEKTIAEVEKELKPTDEEVDEAVDTARKMV